MHKLVSSCPYSVFSCLRPCSCKAYAKAKDRHLAKILGRMNLWGTLPMEKGNQGWNIQGFAISGLPDMIQRPAVFLCLGSSRHAPSKGVGDD